MQINQILVVPSGYTSFLAFLYLFFNCFVCLFLFLPKGVVFSVLSVSRFTHTKTTELAFPETEVKGDKALAGWIWLKQQIQDQDLDFKRTGCI